MSQQIENNVLFHEVQQFRQIWLWMLVSLSSIMLSYGLYTQVYLHQPFGNNPASDNALWILWFFFGVGMPLFMYRIKMTTVVNHEGIQVHFSPFLTRTYSCKEILNYRIKQYGISDYGGYGIRISSSGGALNVSGNWGVELEFIGHKKLLIGSQQSEKLFQAIKTAMILS
ncbi:MAG: hypothetical protein H7X79_06750 [Sporomusaceae bacterium]|nr:hypothetical protein [Sporomusaceae bacterium]